MVIATTFVDYAFLVVNSLITLMIHSAIGYYYVHLIPFFVSALKLTAAEYNLYSFMLP